MIWSTDVYLRYLLSPEFFFAALTVVGVAIVAQLIAVVVGLIVAVFGLSTRRPLRVFNEFYVWLWRGTPVLVQLIVLYLGLPQIGIRLPVIVAGLLGLGLNGAAYMAEIFRSGFLSVDTGQGEASRALGMTGPQTLRLVVLPQVARIVFPPFGNEFLAMLKMTSLLAAISFPELVRQANLAIHETYRSIELYSVAATYYLAMAAIWMAIQAAIEWRLSRGRRGGVSSRRIGQFDIWQRITGGRWAR